MSQAPRDENRIATLIGVSSIDFASTTTVAVNPSTHAVLVEGGGGGTQYIDAAATPAHPTGTIPVFDNGGTITAVSAANPLPVSATVSTVGLATSVKQDTGNTSLNNIDTSTAAVNTVIGAKTDAKSTATDATSVTIMQVLKEISAMVQAPPSQAVTNAGTFAVQATEADGANTTLGSKADAKSTATDTTAITIMQVLKQISASVQTPPSQAVTNAGTFAVQATLQTQTDTVMVGGVNIKEINGVTPLMGVGATGTGAQRTVIANDAGKTIASKGGSASSSGDNTLVAAGTNKLKVFAFSLSTTSTTAVTCIFQSGASGTELWRVVLQAPTSVSTGANLVVQPPAFLFATASATLLNLNLSSANTVHWAVSYFDEA